MTYGLNIVERLEVLKEGDYRESQAFLEGLVIMLLRLSTNTDEKEDRKQLDIPIKMDDLFFGYVLTSLVKQVDFELDAPMAVTYRNNNFILLFNPKHIMKHWTIHNMLDIVRHECYHIIFNHLKRHDLRGKNHQALNIAMDAEINQLLTDLPAEGVTLDYIARLAEMDIKDVKRQAGTDYYYDLIAKNVKDKPNRGKNGKGDSGEGAGSGSSAQSHGNDENNGAGQAGDGEANDGSQGYGALDSHSEWKEAEVGKSGNYVDAEQAAKNVISQALRDISNPAIGRGRGLQSGALKAAVEALFTPPQVKWQSLVERQMGRQISGKRLSPNRLNRRQPHMIHKKGKLNDRILPIVVAVDVSGSVSDKELAYFLNEIRIITEKHKIPLTYIQFDSEIKSFEELTPGQKLDYSINGRGGTSFQPVFDELKERQYPRETQLFIFTDGGGESHINTKGYGKYTWLITDEQQLSVHDNTRQIINISTKK